MTIKLYGTNAETKKETLLGEKEILISAYCLQIKQQIELIMDNGTLKKNRLYLDVSVFAPD